MGSESIVVEVEGFQLLLHFLCFRTTLPCCQHTLNERGEAPSQ